MATKPSIIIKKAAKGLKKESRDFQKEQAYQMFRFLGMIEAQAKANIRSNFRTGTGTLLNSLEKSVEIDGNTVTGTISMENAPHAAMMEFGSDGLPHDDKGSANFPGMVAAKKGKYLAIPTENAKGPDGVARMSPRDIKDAVWKRSSRGGLVMGPEYGGMFIPMFIMKEAVYIPPRPYLAPALDKYRAVIEKRFEIFLTSHFQFGG